MKASDSHGNHVTRNKGKPNLQLSRDGRNAGLLDVELSRWQALTLENRQNELEIVNGRYHELLNELYASANLCVDRYKSFARTHVLWRRTMILGTGVVAVVNLLAANKHLKDGVAGEWLPLLAAGLALVLAIFANLESFANAAEKAQGYRELREVFLDAAREFDRRWDAYVRPFAGEGEANVNASELYRQLVIQDSELRVKLFKELANKKEKSGK